MYENCVKRADSSVKIMTKSKEVFGEDSTSDAHVKLWYQHFKVGWEFVESAPRSGRPLTSRIQEKVDN